MEEKNYHMSLDLTMSIINGKWKSLILCNLGVKSRRNGELLRQIPDISQKVLTQQLKELVDDGVVKRITYPGLPLHVEYSLTPEGKSLRKVLIDMSVWGENHAKKMKQAGQTVCFMTNNYHGYLNIDDSNNQNLERNIAD